MKFEIDSMYADQVRTWVETHEDVDPMGANGCTKEGLEQMARWRPIRPGLCKKDSNKGKRLTLMKPFACSPAQIDSDFACDPNMDYSKLLVDGTFFLMRQSKSLILSKT
jgi:hypothetical protein